jgi:hypothetical protein
LWKLIPNKNLFSMHGVIPAKSRFKDQTRIAVQERKLSNKQQVLLFVGIY